MVYVVVVSSSTGFPSKEEEKEGLVTYSVQWHFTLPLASEVLSSTHKL